MRFDFSVTMFCVCILLLSILELLIRNSSVSFLDCHLFDSAEFATPWPGIILYLKCYLISTHSCIFTRRRVICVCTHTHTHTCIVWNADPQASIKLSLSYPNSMWSNDQQCARAERIMAVFLGLSTTKQISTTEKGIMWVHDHNSY